VKAQALLDDVSAHALSFAFLCDALAPASSYGDGAFERCVPFVPGEEEHAMGRAARIAGIAATVSSDTLDAMRDVFHNVPDATGAIARASMGDALSDANFLELQWMFDACERLDGLSGRAPLPKVNDDGVRACAGAIERGRAGKFGFYLDDAFDVALAKARASLSQAQAEYDAVRGRASAAVATALGREITGTEFIVMRADLNGALPQGVRVVREAPTYVLCEIDADDATLASLARRDDCVAAVAASEERVRKALSQVVREHAAGLNDACDRLGEIDVLVAAARFTQKYNCHVATLAVKSALTFSDGCFVPLAQELEKQGRPFTPISLDLDGVAALTGPNMGGKSVALRTGGFIAMCAAFGVPVPAKHATLGLFSEIAWLGVGADDDDGGLLSSFAREVVRLRDVLARGKKPLLALLDEFARTTTPREGHALLVAVLHHLASLDARAIAATHLAGIAEAAGARHFAVRGLRGIPERPATDDLNAALETLAASMDYTIAEVTSESSGTADAIALAALLGLDKTLIQGAYDAMV
jgi:DNA mismatch repair protein MutS2